MDNVLVSGLSFLQIIILIGAIVASFVVIRVSLKFDVNRYMESRREIASQKLKNTCTHLEIDFTGGDFTYKHLFISPPGTLGHYCQSCGLIVYRVDKFHYEKMAMYYIKNPKEYNKQNKKFLKLLKKSGQL